MLKEEPASLEKPASREPAAPTSFSTAASAYAQDLLYTNGGLNYNVRGFAAASANQQTSPAAITNGKPSSCCLNVESILLVPNVVQII